VPRESSIIMLHTHPDGARLAHAPYVVGLSPGRRVRVGDYECELLMLSPHGGGGNPAYAAAFCLPGEILPSLTPKSGDEGWLSWLGLDDDFDYDEPVQLRAPQLPRPDDPQPTSPIPFGYGGDCVVRTTVQTSTSNGQAQMQAHMSRTNQSYQPMPAEPSRTAPVKPVEPSIPRERVNPEPREGRGTDAPRHSPRAVFEEEFLREEEDEEEAFQRQIRFGTESTNPVVAAKTEFHHQSTKGTIDDMEALRHKLRELERLTGLTAEQAELELKETEEVVTEQTDGRREVEEEEEAKETKQGDSAPLTAMELVRHHEAEVEVPKVSVSSNIFKANEKKTPTQEGAKLVGTGLESLSSLRVERKAELTASAPSVTPEELNANDAWAAAIARRNRSVDESDDESSDDESSSSRAKAAVQRISIAKGQTQKYAAPAAAVAAEEPPAFGRGSVAARASVFGEQIVRRGGT
jgi:hypothetical protein